MEAMETQGGGWMTLVPIILVMIGFMYFIYKCCQAIGGKRK